MIAYLLDDGADLGTLGDLVCTPADCERGQAAMQQALTFLTAATPATQLKHGTALRAVLDRRQAILDRYGQSISNVPVRECCELADLGRQAEEITKLVAADDGKAQPPSVTPPSSGWGDLVKLAIVAAAAIAIGSYVMGARAGRTSPAAPRRRRRG